MTKQSISELSDLIELYQQQQDQHPFLLVDLSGGKENTHTNILRALLTFNKNMFFQSFLDDVLDAPKWDEKNPVKISTQEKAVGLLNSSKNSYGYIDLYIKYNTQENKSQTIVIENKINGAVDTPVQMLRYIATVKEPKLNNEEFVEWKGKISKEDSTELQALKEGCKNCRFYYLTLDGLSDPSQKSLPRVLYQTNENGDDSSYINYNRISYLDGILPWLKEKVLCECPYFDNGITLAGLLQYITSLEEQSLKNVIVSEPVEQYIMNTASEKSFPDLYRRIQDDIKNINIKDIDIRNRLVRELQNATDECFTNLYAPEDWVLHYSPSFTILYKPKWMKLSRGTYSIPFVNFWVGGNILTKKKVSWQLHIEHFAKENLKRIQQKDWISSTNSDRTATCSLNLSDFTQFKLSRDYFTKLTYKLQKLITIVDECVNKVEGSKATLNNDRVIRQELFNELFKKFDDNKEISCLQIKKKNRTNKLSKDKPQNGETD